MEEACSSEGMAQGHLQASNREPKAASATDGAFGVALMFASCLVLNFTCLKKRFELEQPILRCRPRAAPWRSRAPAC